MTIYMFLEVRLMGVCLITLPTRKRLLPGMSPHVILKNRQSLKRLITQTASMRSFVVVRRAMSPQTRLIRKLLITHVALAGLLPSV